MKNWVAGLLAIILGLIVIAFPFLTTVTVSIFAGLLVLMIAIWLFIVGISEFGISKTSSILNIILGVIAFIIGLGLLFYPGLFSFIAGFTLYLAGIFLIITGLIALMNGMERKSAWSGILGIVLGIIYIILGAFAFNPVNLGILIGLWLIITGIFKMFEDI
ncbi:MAG TPA: DUF308 domain-containing protein [Methanobacterium sp.]|nr:DUF308 domain-containing protein [Methanobacterium sp.]